MAIKLGYERKRLITADLERKLDSTILYTPECYGANGRPFSETGLTRFLRHHELIQSRAVNTGESRFPQPRDLKYAEGLKQTLEVVHGLNEFGNYVIIGGIAVLAHLTENNQSAPILWRGTDDLDVLLPQGVNPKSLLLDLGYRVEPRQFGVRNPSGTSGFESYTRDGNQTHKVQLRWDVLDSRGKDITGRILGKSTSINMYGIPHRVIGFDDLVEIKIQAGRTKDTKDVKDLERKALYDELRKK